MTLPAVHSGKVSQTEALRNNCLVVKVASPDLKKKKNGLDEIKWIILMYKTKPLQENSHNCECDLTFDFKGFKGTKLV